MAASEIHVTSTTVPPSVCLGNKPHKCYICGGRFKSQKGLDDHIRTHYDEYYDSLSPIAEPNVSDEDCVTNIDGMPKLVPVKDDHIEPLEQMPNLEPFDFGCPADSNQLPLPEPTDYDLSANLGLMPKTEPSADDAKFSSNSTPRPESNAEQTVQKICQRNLVQTMNVT